MNYACSVHVENHGEDPDFGKIYPMEDRARELYDISDSKPLRDLQSVSMEREREEMTRIPLPPSKPYELYVTSAVTTAL